MTQGRPTYADLARALRDMVALTDYRSLDRGIGVTTHDGAAKLSARNIVRRLPAGDA